MKDFLAYLKRKNYTEETIKQYSAVLSSYLDFAKDINIESIREYLNKLDNKLITRNNKLSIISSYCKYLVTHDQLDSNPAENIDYAKQKESLPEYLTIKEVHELLKVIDNSRDLMIIKTLIYTGMRLSELLSLKKENITQQFIKVTGKGNKERIIPVHSAIADINNYSLDKITNLSPRTIQYIVKKYVRKTNINKNITPHSLRHTFATILYQKTKDLRVLQQLLGHKDITSTQLYTHISNQNKKDTINQMEAIN